MFKSITQKNITTPESDPANYGFKEVERYGKSGGGKTDKDYILLAAVKNGGYRGRGANVILSKDTTDTILELFGNNLSVSTDENGRILLAKGNSRKLSVSQNKKYKRGQVSLYTETKHLMDIFGEFRHVYLDAKLFANGNAILLTPEERD